MLSDFFRVCMGPTAELLQDSKRKASEDMYAISELRSENHELRLALFKVSLETTAACKRHDAIEFRCSALDLQLAEAEGQLQRSLQQTGAYAVGSSSPDALLSLMEGAIEAARAVGRAILSGSQAICGKEILHVWANEMACVPPKQLRAWMDGLVVRAAFVDIPVGAASLHLPYCMRGFAMLEEERESFAAYAAELRQLSTDVGAESNESTRIFKPSMESNLARQLLAVMGASGQAHVECLLALEGVQKALGRLAQKIMLLSVSLIASAAPCSLILRYPGATVTPSSAQFLEATPLGQELPEQGTVAYMVSPGLRINDKVHRKCRVQLLPQ